MEVIIEKQFASNLVEIYLREQKGGVDTYFSIEGDSIQATNIPYSELCVEPNVIKPLLKVPAHFYRELLKAFAKEAKQSNVETEDENHLKGKLEAKEDHLQDLKMITKKLLKIE